LRRLAGVQCSEFRPWRPYQWARMRYFSTEASFAATGTSN